MQPFLVVVLINAIKKVVSTNRNYFFFAAAFLAGAFLAAFFAGAFLAAFFLATVRPPKKFAKPIRASTEALHSTREPRLTSINVDQMQLFVRCPHTRPDKSWLTTILGNYFTVREFFFNRSFPKIGAPRRPRPPIDGCPRGTPFRRALEMLTDPWARSVNDPSGSRTLPRGPRRPIGAVGAQVDRSRAANRRRRALRRFDLARLREAVGRDAVR